MTENDPVKGQLYEKHDGILGRLRKLFDSC